MAFPNKPIAHLTGSNGPILALTYSASLGTYVLTGSADRTIRLYNPVPATPVHPANSFISRQQRASDPAVPEGRLIQSFSGHGHEVLSLAVSSDNARFASAGGDRGVFVWDVATAQTLRRFAGAHGHTSRVNCVSFAGADDSLLVSGGFDTSVRVWDTKSGGGMMGGGGRPIQVFEDAKDSVSSVVVRDAEILAGSVDGRIRTYDVRMGRVTTDVIGASVTSLSLTRDGKAVLVGSLDSKIRLMDRDNGSCLRSYGDQGWRNAELRVQSVLGGKEKFVIAGDEMTVPNVTGHDGRVWMWDILTGKVAAKVAVPWGPAGSELRKKAVGRDGKEKERKYVVSCVAWREKGFGDQFCAGGTSGVVTVFGSW